MTIATAQSIDRSINQSINLQRTNNRGAHLIHHNSYSTINQSIIHKQIKSHLLHHAIYNTITQSIIIINNHTQCIHFKYQIFSENYNSYNAINRMKPQIQKVTTAN